MNGMNDFLFSQVASIKLPTESSYFREKMLYLQMKELFDSIATQNAEIRTVLNRYFYFSNNSLKVYFSIG